MDSNYVKNVLMFLSFHQNKSEDELCCYILQCIKDGADVNAIDGNDNDNTLLHKAVNETNSKLVTVLLENGAKLTIKNKNGYTPMDIAKKDRCGPEIKEIISVLEERSGQQLEGPTNTTDDFDDQQFNLCFKRRTGTSAVGGQLYESKFTSLLLFKKLRTHERFFLGTNMTGVGDLDDITLRYKISNESKEYILFIQTKHRNIRDKNKMKIDDLMNSTHDFGLLNYYDSLVKIKKCFRKNCNDAIFHGTYNDLECNLVLYTPVMNEIDKKYKKIETANKSYLYKLIHTRSDDAYDIFQLNENFMSEYLPILMKSYDTERIKALGIALKKFILGDNKKHYPNMMLNECIKKYHYVLGKHIIDVGNVVQVDDKNNKFLVGNFRNTFLASKNDEMILLKSELFKSVTNMKKYEHDSFSFNLPHTFGNNDLIVQDDSKIDKIVENFLKLFNMFKETKLIKIGDNFCEDNNFYTGFTKINGGLESLVGTLLIFDENTVTLKIDSSFEPSPQTEKQSNIDKFIVKLKQKIEVSKEAYDIYGYRFEIDVDNFTTLFLTNDKIFIKLFKSYCNNLWFYSNQCQEQDVETALSNEIKYQYKLEMGNNFLIQLQSNAICLKFHDKVQKWSMSHDDPKYLNRSCKFYEEAKAEIIESPLLTVIRFVFITKIIKCVVRFNDEAISSLGLGKIADENLLMVKTADCFLTTIKIYQYFNGLKQDNDVIFIDLQFVIDEGYYAMVLSELENTKMKALVLTYKNDIHVQELKKVIESFQKVPDSKSIILVFDKDTNSPFNQTFHNDTKISLINVEDSDYLIKEWMVTFQGRETTLDKIIDNDIKELISPELISMKINRVHLNIGKAIESEKFEEIKKYCIPRYLSKKNEINENIKTFYDIDDNVVLIVAEPGMGKSTLLNQLASQTKSADETNGAKRTWITYIHLSDYFSEFENWTDYEKTIDRNEALRFVFKAAVGIKKIGDTANERCIGKMPFKILINASNDISIKSYAKDIILSFELELFLHYFKQGKVVFLFDGYDEMCPLYEKQILTLLKLLTEDIHNPICRIKEPSLPNPLSVLNFKSLSPVCDCKVLENRPLRFWITTRSYNKIKSTLETEFGRAAYSLEPLSRNQQKDYLNKFFNANISLLGDKNIDNINSFYYYMVHVSADEGKVKKIIDVPLYAVYVAAVELMQDLLDKEKFNLKYGEDIDIGDILKKIETSSSRAKQVSSISDIPLHLYIAAEYFFDQIKTYQNIPESKEAIISKWDINEKSFNLFDHFFKIKYEQIIFKEKRQMDLSIPANRATYENERQESMQKHKKMALFAIFSEADIKKLLSEEEIIKVYDIIKKVESGEEITGIVDYVVNNVPRFIHLVFAEYFTMEHISDLLKIDAEIDEEEASEKLKVVWTFIMDIILKKSANGVIMIFNQKLGNDIEFSNCINNDQNKKIVFDILLKQGRENRVTPEGFNSSLQYVTTAFNLIIEEGFYNLQMYLVSCITVGLNSENLEDFIETISDSLLIFSAIGTSDDELLSDLRICVSNVCGTDRLLSMIMPTFAKKFFPGVIDVLDEASLMRTMQMLIRWVPEIKSLMSGNFSLTPTLRGAISEYLQFFRDLVTGNYLRN